MYSISCIQYNVFNFWLDLSMMSMSPHCASKGIPASLVRCQAASMLVRLTGRKKHEFQGDVCSHYVPRKCLHCKLCTCYIPIDRGGSQEPNMEERSSGQLLLYIGRQPGRWWWLKCETICLILMVRILTKNFLYIGKQQPAQDLDQERSRCRVLLRLFGKPDQGRGSGSPVFSTWNIFVFFSLIINFVNVFYQLILPLVYWLT